MMTEDYQKEPTEAEIARRAFEIYERRGGTPGDGRAEEDWRRAIAELSPQTSEYTQRDQQWAGAGA